jgi:hypothetical protein
MRDRTSNLRRQLEAIMKVQIGHGPFSVSTDVETIASLAWMAVKAVLGLLLVFWPLMLGQKANGQWHPWVWAIAIPWWILVVLLAIGHFIRKAEESKRAHCARVPSDQ